MGLETGTYLDDLVTTNPVGATDKKKFGDDHLRLIKSVLKTTFPDTTFPVLWGQDFGGSATALTLTPGTAPAAYVDKMLVIARVTATNTGAATLNVSSLGAKAINKNGRFALTGGEMLEDGVAILQYELTDDVFVLLNPASAPQVTAKGVLAPHKNLRLVNGGTATTQITITADELMVFDTYGNGRRLTSVNETVTMGTSGADGLDTGVEANSTWYHLWIIYDPATATTAGLLSTSSSAPTLPSGYTEKGYVGAIYNDSGGNFIDIWQVNHRVACEDINDLSGGTASSSVAVTLTVPSTAVAATGTIQIADDGSGNAIGILASQDRDSNNIGGFQFRAQGMSGSHTAAWPYEITLISAQTVYYTATNGDVTLRTNGWLF